MGIKIDIVSGDLDELIRDVEALAPAARRALVRSIRRVTRSAATEAGRDIARRSGVPIRALTQGDRRRVHARLPNTRERTDAGLRGSVWVGYNPVGASRLGTLRQTSRSVLAGRVRFPGAFLATMRSGFRSAFRRADPVFKRSPGRPVTSSPNLPIEEASVPLTVVEPVMREIEKRGRARLRDVLLRELNFELNVKGRT